MSKFKPGLGMGVVYVTHTMKRRHAVIVAEPESSHHVDLTVFTAGNEDNDWLQGNESSARDIRTQARLVVRRGNVPYDSSGANRQTWHWYGDEKE